MTGKPRAAILISGRGSNMQALIEAAAAPEYPARIAGVLSNVMDAPGLALAARAGIATAVRPHRDYASREAFDTALGAVLSAWRTDFVCLAGFMRLLTPGFVLKWRGKMINIHPALLPAFKGLNTHQRALDAGVTAHGCTVHFVSPEMDEGEVIAQAKVPVLPTDNAQTLGARVLEAEHTLYPRALAGLATGAFRIPSLSSP